MTFLTSYNYRYRMIFDLFTLINVLRFIILNAILAVIFVFLSFEEIDWAILSYTNKINDKVIDDTSWNIKDFF